MAITLVAFGVGAVIDGKHADGIEEAALGVLLGFAVGVWAWRHPGYTWWRWQKETER